MYICWKCKNEIKEIETKFVRCPHCGCRVLFKQRQPVAKEVSTD